jgi:hypothetical protein
MRILDRLEKYLRPYAITNLTVGLIGGQVLLYLISHTHAHILESAALVPREVLRGELWRLVTYIFLPPLTHPIFALLFWYFFYLMGTTLENYWGTSRYNIFLLVGFAATVAVSFLTPDLPASNAFVQGSVFLAFAYLFPDFVVYLFFILPVKIKWLALAAWVGYFFAFANGSWQERGLVLAAVSNFLLFFGKDIAERMRTGRRRMAWQARGIALRDQPRHRCVVCGITNLSHPKMEFRYCSKCHGPCGYCTEHLRNHEHITDERAAKVEAG